MPARFFDNYSSTLSGSYTSGGTSLSITAAGSGATALPATAGDYYLVVEPGTANEEVFKVTARSTLTLTVVGAQAGTSAANHSSGAEIKGPIWTADGIEQMRQNTVGSLTVSAFDALSGNGGYTQVRLTDGLYTALWNGSSWDYYFRDRKVTRPLVANFTAVNLSGTTTSSASGAINLYAPAGTDNIRMYMDSPAGTAWTRTLTFIPGMISANYTSAGMVLRESGTGKLKTWAISNEATAGFDSSIISNLYSNPTTYTSGSTPTARGYNFGSGQPVTLRIVSDATNLSYFLLPDGITPVQLGASVARGTGFTSAPDQVGFFVNANNANMDSYITAISWD